MILVGTKTSFASEMQTQFARKNGRDQFNPTGSSSK